MEILVERKNFLRFELFLSVAPKGNLFSAQSPARPRQPKPFSKSDRP